MVAVVYCGIYDGDSGNRDRKNDDGSFSNSESGNNCRGSGVNTGNGGGSVDDGTDRVG